MAPWGSKVAEDVQTADQEKEVAGENITTLALWYSVFIMSILFLWLMVYVTLKLVKGQKRVATARAVGGGGAGGDRMYVATVRTRAHTHPSSIYVTPVNMAPPKYEDMSPPSYEEVVGIHYPNPNRPLTLQVVQETAVPRNNGTTNQSTVSQPPVSQPTVSPPPVSLPTVGLPTDSLPTDGQPPLASSSQSSLPQP